MIFIKYGGKYYTLNATFWTDDTDGTKNVCVSLKYHDRAPDGNGHDLESAIEDLKSELDRFAQEGRLCLEVD